MLAGSGANLFPSLQEWHSGAAGGRAGAHCPGHDVHRERRPLGVDKVQTDHERCQALQSGQLDDGQEPEGFTKDLTRPLKLTLLLDNPELEVRAKYDVDGKLLILPIVSKGDLTIRLNDVHTKVWITAEPVKRSDGHTYLNITDYKTATKIKG